MTTDNTAPCMDNAVDCAKNIPLADIRPSPWQVRKDMGDMKGLTESIRKDGIINPIIVRAGAEKDTWELIAGHRRHAAAAILGWPEIKARVVKLSDEEAERVVLLDNVQRLDLDPFEASAAIAKLQERGMTLKQISTELNLVLNRIRDLASLSTCIPALRKLAEKAGWDVTLTAYLAKQSEAMQEYFVGELGDGGRLSWFDINQAKRRVDSRTGALSTATWPLERAEWLDKKIIGACATCPLRSSCRSELFPEYKAKDDRCLNVNCFQAKRVEISTEETRKAVEAATAKLKDFRKVRIVSTDSRVGKHLVENAGMKVLDVTEYTLKEMPKAKATDKGAMAIIDAATAKTYYVTAPKPEESSTGMKKLAGKPQLTPKEELKVKLEGLEGKRMKWIADELVLRLFGREGRKIEFPKDVTFGSLLYGMGVTGANVYGHLTVKSPKPVETMAMFMANEVPFDPVSPFIRDAANAFKEACGRLVTFRVAAEADEDKIRWICSWWQLDIGDLFAKAENAVPEPKNFAKLREAAKGKKSSGKAPPVPKDKPEGEAGGVEGAENEGAGSEE